MSDPTTPPPPTLREICIRSVDNARQVLPLAGLLAEEHCPQLMGPLRRIEGNLNKIYDAAYSPPPTPAADTTGTGRMLLAERLQTKAELSYEVMRSRRQMGSFNSALVHEKIGDAYTDSAIDAADLERRLLAVVDDLRRESLPIDGEAFDVAIRWDAMRKAKIDAADRIEAAMRGDGRDGETGTG